VNVISSEPFGALYGAILDQAANPEIAVLGKLAFGDFRYADEKHHAVFHCLQRQARRNCDADNYEANRQHALLSGSHRVSPSAFMRTSMSLYTRR
jgi:hypothetical protein